MMYYGLGYFIAFGLYAVIALYIAVLKWDRYDRYDKPALIGPLAIGALVVPLGGWFSIVLMPILYITYKIAMKHKEDLK